MELQKQVCSLELSKQLKNLGFKQESYFYWNHQDYSGDVFYNITHIPGKGINAYQECSAYTVAELGEMLPYKYNNFRDVDEKYHCVAKFDDLSKDKNLYISSKTESDARAKMLIYLKENNLI